MGARRNGFYNDPAIGQAFDNLASAFAPPSASDTYAYAKAAETRQKQQQLADLFAQAGRQMTPEEMQQFDQRNIAAGNYSWSGSRYGVDLDAGTKLKTNAADNARALAERKLQEQGLRERQLLEPVKVGANETVLLPKDNAAATGLPSMFTGAVRAGTGETVTLPTAGVGAAPGNPTIAGPAKPLNVSEWEAAESERLKKEGKLTDSMLRAKVMGATPIESTPAEDGTLVNAYRPDVIGKPTVSDSVSMVPDGKGGMIPVVTKGAAGGGKSAEWQAKFGVGASQLKEPVKAVRDMIAAGYKPTTQDYLAFNYLMQNPGLAQLGANVMSPDAQVFFQNMRPIVAQAIFIQSGQAATEQEVNRKLMELLVVPGEDARVTAAKTTSMQNLFDTVDTLAGPAGTAQRTSNAPTAASPTSGGAQPAAPAAVGSSPGGAPAPALPADKTPMPPAGTPVMPMPSGVPAPAERTPNTVYQTPKGPMKWTGTGWLPAN